jgi:hypothetical protein
LMLFQRSNGFSIRKRRWHHSTSCVTDIYKFDCGHRASNMQKRRRPAAEVMGDGFANRDGAKCVRRQASDMQKGWRPAGEGLVLELGAPLGGVPCLLLSSGLCFACFLRCHCSLFDPRRRRGRILRDVPRPDANRGARSAARSPKGEAQRSTPPRRG